MLKYAFDGLLIKEGYLFLFIRINCNKFTSHFVFTLIPLQQKLLFPCWPIQFIHNNVK